MHDVWWQMKIYRKILHTQSHYSTGVPESLHEELHNYVI